MSTAGASVIPFPYTATWEPWLSKRQIADYFGRSTRWVELRVREGLPSKMIGGRRGFRLSEVEAWLDRRNP
jgi:predicted DNA-binding transcriptional regulator AlpA